MGIPWIKLPETFLCKSFCGHMFLFLLGKYFRVKLLDHRVGLTLQDSAKLAINIY